MDKQPPQLMEFLEKVKKRFKPEKIILFGSKSKGNYWERSDYDFIIVSSKFEGVHWLDRISKVVRLWELECDIDVLPYTPKEFDHKKRTSSTVKNAVEEGKELAKA